MGILVAAIIVGAVFWLTLLLKDRVKAGKSTVQTKKVNDETKLIDYSTYKMKLKEHIFFFLLAGIILYTISFIFYQNHFISIVFALFAFYYPKLKMKDLIKKRKQDLLFQFKQSLYSLSSALAAGKSVENAFKEASLDLKMLYPDPNTYIIREFDIINRRIENGEAVEHAVTDFAFRADIEDIANFADVFTTGKKTGGDLVEIIRRTSNIIGEKIEIQQEITVLIAQKKFEARLLAIAPFVMVGLISYSSPDYMSPLYQFGIGPVIMTGALILLAFSLWLTKWIMDIRM